jgi:TPP-dependent pyruvate/acetoin dehydrogenase alpha subunit
VNAEQLRAFEKRVAEAFENKQVKGPIHLSAGNEEQLIDIFKGIKRDDWICTTYRSHYHALLHGIPEEWLWQEILDGRSMTINSPKYRFLSSAIVGGMLSIACGIAATLKSSDRKVWCFIGDMACTTGAYHEAQQYASANKLPVKFVIEDNGLSVDSPTDECWGPSFTDRTNELLYTYERGCPHSGTGVYVVF